VPALKQPSQPFSTTFSVYAPSKSAPCKESQAAELGVACDCRHLEALEFCQEWAVAEKHLPYFQRLVPGLTELQMGRCRLTAATLPLVATLTNLEHLDLQGSCCAAHCSVPGPI
jgi:hypothetical protein